MSPVQTLLPTDTWVTATWDEYLTALNDPIYSNARGYYFNGRMRLEMSPLGNPHSRDHFIISLAIGLFASLRGIDLDGPDLVIEVAYSSLADDKGEKRLLYESLGVQEYWIIDVQAVKLIAFEVKNQGSYRIKQSQVLPGLQMGILEEAFRRSRQTNHGKVSAWLLSEFQG